MAEIEINRINQIDPNTPEGQAELVDQLKELANNPNINKPSKEECDQYKKEFEDMGVEFSASRWSLGNPAEGEEIIDYLRHYSRVRHLWKGNEWMGVIKLQEELDNSEKDYKIEGSVNPVNFSYPAIEFLFHIFQNPGGVGYESALSFELENKVYAKIFDYLGSALKDSRKALQDIEFSQQKWQAAEQGFYLEKSDGVEAKDCEDCPDEEGEGYYDKDLEKQVRPSDPEFDIQKFREAMAEKYKKEIEESYPPVDMGNYPDVTDHLEGE